MGSSSPPSCGDRPPAQVQLTTPTPLDKKHHASLLGFIPKTRAKPSKPTTANTTKPQPKVHVPFVKDTAMEEDDSDDSDYKFKEQADVDESDGVSECHEGAGTGCSGYDDDNRDEPTFEVTDEHDALYDWAWEGLYRDRRRLLMEVLGTKDGRLLADLLHDVQQRIVANGG